MAALCAELTGGPAAEANLALVSHVSPIKAAVCWALGIDPRKWIDGAKLADGPPVAGDQTDRITGKLDVAAALRDLLGLARQGGASLSADDE